MWYRVVLLIHILAGIAWLGGGLAIWVTQQRALRAGGRAALDRVRRDLAWADTWLAIPSPLLVVATGIAMVLSAPGWRLTQTWIWLTSPSSSHTKGWHSRSVPVSTGGSNREMERAHGTTLESRSSDYST